MKRFLIPILGLAVVGGLFTASLAAADQIYISNHLFTGRTVKESGSVWLNLDDFVKASGVGPSGLPHTGLDNGQIQITYNKKSFFVPAESRNDGLYVDGRRLVEGMGGRWIFNSSLGLTDVAIPAPARYRPTTVAPGSEAPSPPPAANPTASASAAASASPGETVKAPIHIEKFSYIDPTLPGNFANVLVHGTVTIKNTQADYVDGVTIIVHIQDGYENDLATLKHEVGKLDGAESSTWEWQWSNSSAMLIHPVVEVECNPFISKATRDKMAKDKTTPPEGKKISVRSGPTEGVPAASATVGQGAAGNYNLNPQDTPTPTASNYTAPTGTMVPPGFNPGQDQSGSGSPNPSDTASNPPGF